LAGGTGKDHEKARVVCLRPRFELVTYRISPPEADESKREPTERIGTKGVFPLCLLKWT
jgi:hypothetical protein